MASEMVDLLLLFANPASRLEIDIILSPVASFVSHCLFAHDSSLPVAHKVFQLIHALAEHLLCAKGIAACSMTLNKSVTHPD